MSTSPIASPEEWLRYMPAAQQQQQELRLVESAWDHLSLLSSLSLLSTKASSGSDLARARHDFAALSGELMRGLAREALRNRLDDLANRAQICIDVLVRNLFERTADIGFLALDGPLARYLDEGRHSPGERSAIESRLKAYAGKYTVYGNIFLFDAQCRPCACLHGDLPAPGGALHDRDQQFLREVLGSDAAYVEHHALHGFTGRSVPTLVYAHRVVREGRTVGVLCLEFRLADEMPAIFESLRDTDEGEHSGIDAVLAMVDGEGRVLASGDPLQLPVDWRIPEAGSGTPDAGQVVRHMGRRYLLAVRRTQGFQGYAGPGWRGVAMLPLDGAFEERASMSDGRTHMAGRPDLLSEELRGIPLRSAAIQSALERSVWNGLLELNQIGGGEAVAAREVVFARTLLSEIGATARKTARAFAAALEGLYGVVTQSQLRDAQSRASLAMQILDRNLYERANDCRWWALTPRFAQALADSAARCEASAAVLAEINALYTVYACLVLFDRSGRVVAVSRPDRAHHVGTVLDEPWVARCLRLPSEQAYTVSDYVESRFHPGSPTFVYAAAVRSAEDAAALGGVAVVWDAAQQLDSILADCAAGLGEQDLLAFVDAAGTLARASRTGAARAQEAVSVALDALRVAPGERMVSLVGGVFGVGVDKGHGYREFRAQDGYDHGLRCIALRRLCASDDSAGWGGRSVPVPAASAPRRETGSELQLATFLVGEHWFGIGSAHVAAAAQDVAVLQAGRARAPFLGLAQIGERVCPVVDMHSLVADQRGRAGWTGLPSGLHQLIVLRIGLDDGRTGEFALRVDGLGPMLDMDARQLQPVAWPSAAGQAPLIDAVLSVPVDGGAGKRMLCRIGAPWLRQCAAGALGPEPPLDLAALVAAG
ncbi:chemotaxis protein CheW [Paracidovorax cattleyae]|uniref:Chemotaxis signal transduction protein n=1 Tax=Paracidovorax cattleyae TaxID=80868 RepID=A0A1H0LAS4_9BURK|nr:chemotaxis protein CheW [Paracidovorax cattleyae]AVS75294.1 chemotaxis protein CheW [Paracidovorax cattleyae]SDO65369.1 Chemotaxis signal transduction protein [Paracidovorax cattleyae]